MNVVTRIPQSNLTAFGYSRAQLDTIKRTVAKDTNDIEFNLLMEYAAAKQLDPFSKQVIAIVFNKNDEAKRQMTIITTQDGLRVMAARCGDYRPEESEPEYEYDAELKGPANPLGIVKCTVKLWKQDGKSGQWHPVNGTAYWDEYAPIKKTAESYEYVDTGETWADTGKPKKKKVAKGEITEAVDDSGQWKRMGRTMIAKCARAAALRGGWPTVFSGVYSEEEMDRARVSDLTASELVAQEEEDRRAKAIAMSSDEYPWVGADGNLTFVAAGRYCDHVMAVARSMATQKEVADTLTRNREAMMRFWARHKDDALQLRKELDKLSKELAGGV